MLQPLLHLLPLPLCCCLQLWRLFNDERGRCTDLAYQLKAETQLRAAAEVKARDIAAKCMRIMRKVDEMERRAEEPARAAVGRREHSPQSPSLVGHGLTV